MTLSGIGSSGSNDTDATSATNRDALRARFDAARTAANQYLGLTDDQVRAKLDAGQSLGDIATAEGKSVDGLQQAITGALQSNGATGDVSSFVDRFVSAKPGAGAPGVGGGHHHRHHGGGQFGKVADAAENYLGIDQQTLQSDLASGKSLSDIATAQGKDVDGLKNAILGALQNKQSSSSGSLQQFVDDIVSRTATNLAGGIDAVA